ncbi:MAG: hypothetical protein DYG99_03900 [Bacteroidetes bacterium CHB5]|nr:hypothetical protein [Bacteroidetes bacterium CHB5]
MNPYKKFLLRYGGGSLLGLVLLVSLNIWIDLYGLFWRKNAITVYSDERTSKYLLAHKYVPENFEGYILGPSLSANLNPKEIPGLRIYNLSMMGANITEQNAVLQKALQKGTPRFVILCLHPYLTADHGMKTGMINPKEYYGALGSYSLYKAYGIALVRHLNLMPGKYPKDQFNDYGYNFYNNILQKMPVADKINAELQLENAIPTAIDSIALTEFDSMIKSLTDKKVAIIAYYHPLPYPLYKKYQTQLDGYKQKISGHLQGKAIVLDFNTEENAAFTRNFANYIDHGHVSEQGQHTLLHQIISNARIRPAN